MENNALVDDFKIELFERLGMNSKLAQSTGIYIPKHIKWKPIFINN